MTLADEYKLSFYRDLAPLKDGVTIVQQVETGKLYVKKQLTVYSADVYQQLLAQPISGTPRIFEVLEDDGVLTVIEEYLSGDTLDIILQNGPLPAETADRYLEQLCAIVRRLHSAKPAIIHRDIKPANILVTADGCLRLLDMNAARQNLQGSQRDTCLIGTVGYAAPEQYGFGASNPQTDIYAIGVLYHEMRTGSKDLSVPVSGRAGRIISRCTRIDAARRYRSVDELLRVLHHATPTEGWRRYLPPGFRSLRWWKMLIAGFGYLLIFSFVFSGVPTPGGRIVDAIVLLPMLLSIVLLNCNYCGILEWLHLKKGPARPFLLILYDVVMFFLAFFFAAMITFPLFGAQ